MGLSGGKAFRYIATVDAAAPANTPRMRSQGAVPSRASSHFPTKRHSRMATTNCTPIPANSDELDAFDDEPLAGRLTPLPRSCPDCPGS